MSSAYESEWKYQVRMKAKEHRRELERQLYLAAVRIIPSPRRDAFELWHEGATRCSHVMSLSGELVYRAMKDLGWARDETIRRMADAKFRRLRTPCEGHSDKIP